MGANVSAASCWPPRLTTTATVIGLAWLKTMPAIACWFVGRPQPDSMTFQSRVPWQLEDDDVQGANGKVTSQAPVVPSAVTVIEYVPAGHWPSVGRKSTSNPSPQPINVHVFVEHPSCAPSQITSPAANSPRNPCTISRTPNNVRIAPLRSDRPKYFTRSAAPSCRTARWLVRATHSATSQLGAVEDARGAVAPAGEDAASVRVESDVGDHVAAA